jgi:hypothetical protein
MQREARNFSTGGPASLNFEMKIDIRTTRKAFLSIVFDKYNERMTLLKILAAEPGM